jgi:1,2-diacylglycerol 3-alpha-glucosyltransferase
VNILFVSSSIAEYKEAGGIVTHLDLLKDRLRKRGHNVYNVISWPILKIASEDEENVTFVSPPLEDFIPVRYHINTLKAYHRIKRNFRPDVVHVHSMAGLSILVFENRIPIVTTLHSINPLSQRSQESSRYSLITRIYTFLENIVRKYQMACLFDYSDHVIIVSEKTRRDILEFHPRINITLSEVLSPGIDRARFTRRSKAEAKRELGYADEFILLYVGRMVKQKRALDIVKALSSVISEIPHIKVIFIGTGGDIDSLEGKTREVGLEDYVQFIGGVKNRDLPVYYNAADLFINPTDENETFGIATGEAMACGTPILISIKGARTGIVTEREAIIYRDIKELSEKIILLYRDLALREELSERAYKYVERYSFSQTDQRMNEIYQELSAKRKRRNFILGHLFLFFIMDSFGEILRRSKAVYKFHRDTFERK